MKIKARVLTLVVACLVCAQVGAGVGEGQEMYDGFCQVCHGDLGQGQTMGKSLTDGVANRLSDAELIEVIANGRNGTGMIAWGGSFTDAEIFDIATYVRVLQGRPPVLNIDGGGSERSDDPQVLAGEEVFNGVAGCITCHSYQDQGASVGPPLDGVGARLGEAALLEALENPSASIADGYAVKVVQQQDGTKVTGRFRNDSELAVQIQSADGNRWVTYFKDRVRSVTDSDESLMPEVYADLSTTEQEQLLAFLRSL